MRLNSITLKKYPDSQLIKNIIGSYTYIGDRLTWTKIKGPITKEEFLQERKATEDFSKKNVRWDGELVE